MSDPLSESRIAEAKTIADEALSYRDSEHLSEGSELFAETILALIAAHDRLSRENAALKEVAKAVQAYADAPADDDGAKYRARFALWRAANALKAGSCE